MLRFVAVRCSVAQPAAPLDGNPRTRRRHPLLLAFDLGRWAWRLPKARMPASSRSTHPCAMMASRNFERQQCNSE